MVHFDVSFAQNKYVVILSSMTGNRIGGVFLIPKPLGRSVRSVRSEQRPAEVWQVAFRECEAHANITEEGHPFAWF